jgi:chlorinating enzyme
MTPEQREALDREGFLAPLWLCSPTEMARRRSAVEAAVAAPGPYGGDQWSARHQDCPAVLDLCREPAVTDLVAAVLGGDLVVWNSVLMHKAPGDREIPWHQDHDFHYLDPDVGLAIWLAIDGADRDNGCLEVIPGTHTRLLPATARSRPDEFDSHVDDADVAGRTPVYVELAAGQFMLFHNKILHRSAPNRSDRRRLGLAARYTTAAVTVHSDKLFRGHRVVAVR